MTVDGRWMMDDVSWMMATLAISASFGYIWLLLATFGNFSLLLATLGYFWILLAWMMND